MKPLILLIDADPYSRQVLEEFLLQPGYCVLHASNSTEGIQVASKIRVDLVIIDEGEPGCDSGFFTEWLSKSPEPVPVITIADRVKELEPNPVIKGNLQKPFSLIQLGELIYNALSKYHFQHFSSDFLAPYYYFE